MPRPKEFTVRLEAADRAKLTKVVSFETQGGRVEEVIGRKKRALLPTPADGG